MEQTISKKQKLYEFYLKHKASIFLPAITLLLFFACYYSPLWIVATVLTVVFYMGLDLGELFCYTFYFGLFSGIKTYYIVSLLIGFCFMVIRYIVDLARKRAKFYLLPFVLTTVYILIFSLINYGYDTNGLDQGVLIISLLYVAYFVLVYGKTISVSKCFKYLSIAIFVSLALGLLSLVLPKFGWKIYYYDGTYKRLQLFTYHQNHLAIICAFAICYYLTAMINKKKNRIMCAALIICYMLIGLFTLSKAFIVLLVIIALYAIVVLIKKYKWKSFRLILPALVFLIVFCLCSRELVFKIIDRFTAYYRSGTETLIYKITTGRSGIWSDYIADLTKSIAKMFFGVGLFSKELYAIGPHNVFVYFLYRSGLLGFVLLGLIIWSYYRETKGKFKIKLNNCLLLAIFVIVSMEEMIFSDRFFFFLILGILMTKVPEENTEKIENETSTILKEKITPKELSKQTQETKTDIETNNLQGETKWK